MQTIKEIEIKQVAIGDLRPDPANPRRISDEEIEALARSIREFGLIDPIIARKEDNKVIGGHQRLLAARRLGYKTVPVVFLNLSQEKARLLNIALNKISGSFDQELLARLLSELNEVPDLDLTLSGFEEEELKKLLKSLEAREKRERMEDFDLDEAIKAAQAKPVAQPGDVWLLGDQWLEEVLAIISLKDEVSRVKKLRQDTENKLRRMAKAYIDGLFPDEEYHRQKKLLEMELESLVVPAANAAEEAGNLIKNLRNLWAEANMTEQRKLLLTMLDAVYMDTKQTRSVVAIKPKPPFRPIFQVAAKREGSRIHILNELPQFKSANPSVFLVETGEGRTPRPEEATQDILQA